MPERRPASRLQGVPDPRAGIDAGGARGAGVTSARPLRAVSLSAAGADDPFGLDAERLARDMENSSLDALIERSAIIANALGVRGTPACHWRRHDPGCPAAGAVPRSHRGGADRAGRRAEWERRRLKRAPRHPARAAAGAAARRPRLRPRRLDDDASAPPPEQVAAARDRERALLHQRPEGIHNQRRVRVQLPLPCILLRQPLGEGPLADLIAHSSSEGVELAPLPLGERAFIDVGRRCRGHELFSSKAAVQAEIQVGLYQSARETPLANVTGYCRSGTRDRVCNVGGRAQKLGPRFEVRWPRLFEHSGGSVRVHFGQQSCRQKPFESISFLLQLRL